MKKNCEKALKISCLTNKNTGKWHAKRIGFEPRIVIPAVVTLLLLVLVAYPFMVLVAKSFGITVHGVAFTCNAYLRAFSDKQTLTALGNTFYVAVGVTVLASLIGGGLAWLVTRTDLPFKKGIRLTIFLTFIIPSYIMAVAWIELLGRNGYISRFLIDIFKLADLPVEIYSLEGVIFIMTIHLYPLVFMAISNALKTTEPALEKAAILCGASRFKALISITFPLVLPSILSIGLLVFNRAMSCFGVAAVIGLPTGNYILPTRILGALSSLDLPLATAVSMILVLCSAFAFLLHNLLLRKKRYTVVTSSSCSPVLISLGLWRVVVISAVFLFMVFTTVLPLMTIIMSSFLKMWGLNPTLGNITFGNYYKILFDEDLTVRALRNSVMFGALAATAAVVLGSVVSYVSNKTRLKGRRLLEFLATWPMAIPGTVMAVAAILTWINPPLKLYGTPWIILVTYIAACLPFVVKNVSGLVQNLDPVLEKATRVAGASWLRTYKDVTIPIIMPGLRTGWILSFLFALREIPISIMLYTYGSETIGVLLFNLRSDTGGLETISAVAVIVIILTILGNLLIEKFGRSRMEVH